VPFPNLNADDVFRCTRCGECCRGFGGTYVSRQDIAAVAAFLGTDPAELMARGCLASGGRYLLAQRPDGYCIFWDQGCTIHPVKPRMCRRWPFIESVAADASNWEAMASCCPGMRTDVPLEQVQACVRRLLAAEAPATVQTSP
jgi:Fe-S-cluster containining protein